MGNKEPLRHKKKKKTIKYFRKLIYNIKYETK